MIVTHRRKIISGGTHRTRGMRMPQLLAMIVALVK